MKKKGIIIGVVLSVSVVGFGGFEFYKGTKAEALVDESVEFIKNGDYVSAYKKILDAGDVSSKNKKVIEAYKSLKYEKEGIDTLNKATALKESGKQLEALEMLTQIDDKATFSKERGKNLAKDIKDNSIEENIKKAEENILKNNFEEAKKNIQAIENLEKENSNVALLSKKLNDKKEELINLNIKEAKSALNNKKYNVAEEKIGNIKKLDKNNKALVELNASLDKKIKNEKFYNNEFRGLSNNVKVEKYMSPHIGEVKLMISEYNPDIIDNKSFIDFYNKNIKPYRKHGVIYNLVNINKPNEGFTFAGAANEHNEFNKGKISQSPSHLKGTIDIEDKNTQYCGMRGYELTSYMLSNHAKVEFKFD
ncbi:MAG: hypothetical protein ACRC28_00085 [Clostridium sp.]|uniref:hypothetical protein n=1 Tax=Clostridium sp. TaxID=1506 RepID=UPI003F331146